MKDLKDSDVELEKVLITEELDATNVHLERLASKYGWDIRVVPENEALGDTIQRIIHILDEIDEVQTIFTAVTERIDAV